VTTYTEFALWLVPGESLRSSLRSTIRKLATQLDAVEFEPHVTVFCGPSSDEEAQVVVERIASRFAPVELTADRLDHTAIFTKTLVVQFRESADLRRMFEMARNGYARNSGYVLNPHLSLLYKKLPEATQRELCRTLDVSMGRYGFDCIQMIATELPIEDAGPIRRWRVVCENKLAGW
jgi:putative hydrolase of the HAD superfamily